MAIILNIDTATETAGVCLAKDGVPVATLLNHTQKDHAGWIQTAIRELFREAGASYGLSGVQAVAVTAGPGSYTGLRVGMATAKGLCYALQVPLLTENTLKVMAYAAREHLEQQPVDIRLQKNLLFCPMIDARRMEVFTALYNKDLEEVMAPAAIILENDSFNKELENNAILFLGNGSAKWKPVKLHANAQFLEVKQTVVQLAPLAEQLYLQEKYADLAYEEPVYLKEFYTYTKK